ncbi:MAG: protocatechuate 3,4-dioxygenase [Gammaproteobacteria bacterium]|nr:protocatechuate 3,4-dioxygenase [Gammaproteobacteria bacterium]|tara:strand:- start:49297 stop:50139 length:843 start_codon:yes stop_codon:yes gene_type:complete
MGKIVAGLGTSHVPAIGVAHDQGLTEEPYWKPLFDGYGPAREWLKKIDPDVVILVYNDHGTVFSLQSIPTFAIGVAEQYKPADEGWGPRPVPVVEGDANLSWHLAESLILDEFDMTIMNEMDVDHGLTVPLSITCGHVDKWPFKVIPLAVNVVLYPPPTGNRCYNLGRAIRKAVEAYDEDTRVVIMGTGGMSHQLHGERAGLINREWDNRFLDDLSKDPERLRKIPHLEYVRETGAEGIEMVMWLVMRGALDDNVKEVYRHYHVPASNTGAGLIVLENDA